jgi:hypothetical protein
LDYFWTKKKQLVNSFLMITKVYFIFYQIYEFHVMNIISQNTSQHYITKYTSRF